MAFLHTCRLEIGFCDCGEVIFYQPKNKKEIKDNIYDWVLVGDKWQKLKYCELDTEWLIECKCIFAH
jgi:hypothetical protein